VRIVAVSVDHALRRDLVASAGVSLSDKRYVGANLREDDLVFSSGLTYKVDRNIQTFVKGSLERFTSSSSASNYNAAAVMVGVRLQRLLTSRMRNGRRPRALAVRCWRRPPRLRSP